jgi:hypothetical protein
MQSADGITGEELTLPADCSPADAQSSSRRRRGLLHGWIPSPVRQRRPPAISWCSGGKTLGLETIRR